MKTRTATISALDWMLGSFGMALIWLIAWAYEQEPRAARSWSKRARHVATWLVVECVTAIGWTFDRIAPVEERAKTTCFATVQERTHGGLQR
jgi:hypothetical protein